MRFLMIILVQMSRLKKKRGRKSNYVKNHVNTNNHKIAKVKAMSRDGNACKGLNCASIVNLELHHISYHVLGKELETGNLRWCVILCSSCHQKAHSEIDNIYNPKNPYRQPVY